MTAIQARLVWLEAVSQKVRGCVERSGDISRGETAFLASLVFRAVSDLAKSPSVTEPVRRQAKPEPTV
jgi:hypothetical protein